jgi:uncharacterized phage infection (PIP) family protein YhgE
MNLTKGKLILLMAVPLAIALVWGIITTDRLAASRSALQSAQNNLTQTQNELADAQQQVTDLQTELKTTQDTLTQTQSILSQTRTQLDTTQTALDSAKTQLSATQIQLSTTQSQLATTQNQLATANSDLSSAKSQLADTQSQLASSMQQLSDYKKTMQALGITVHSSTTSWTFNGLTWTHNDNSQAVNPTWSQLTTFIAQDKTDQHPYDVNSFNCVNYATTVYNNAEKSNIESATVTLKLKNLKVGHAVNAFITSDYGLVYVDCTGNDAIARVEAGKVYRAVAPGVVQPGQIRNNTYWDTLRSYYYLSNDYGGQAVVDSIDIYW